MLVDYFYTGVELLEALCARGLLACGTVRANRRSLPANLLPRNVNLHRGEFRVAQKDDLMCSVWMDTKAVLILSNCHHPAAHSSVERRNDQGVRGPVVVSKALEDYQLHMKGVDLCDQMIGYHLINHRSKKWWRPADGCRPQCVHRRKRIPPGGICSSVACLPGLCRRLVTGPDRRYQVGKSSPTCTCPPASDSCPRSRTNIKHAVSAPFEPVLVNVVV